MCDHITKFSDIATIELVCKGWLKISRNRTRLTNRTRILSPNILQRFPNLLIVDGCFNNIGPLLKSRLRRFDYLLMPITSPAVLYMPSLSMNEIIESYAALTTKPEIKIYSYFGRSLIYILLPYKMIQFCDNDMSNQDFNDIVKRHMGQKFQIELHIPSSNIRLLQRVRQVNHVVLEHNPEFVIDDDRAIKMTMSHLELLSKFERVTIATTKWWAMRYRQIDENISIIPYVRRKKFPLSVNPCDLCAAFPCEECNLCPGDSCQACRCHSEQSDMFDETLVEETDQTPSCNPPIFKWLAALFRREHSSLP